MIPDISFSEDAHFSIVESFKNNGIEHDRCCKSVNDCVPVVYTEFGLLLGPYAHYEGKEVAPCFLDTLWENSRLRNRLRIRQGVEGFRELYRLEYGVELTPDEAREAAERFLSAARIVLKPMPVAFLSRYKELLAQKAKKPIIMRPHL